MKQGFTNYTSINYNHLRPPHSSLDIKPKGKDVLENTNNPERPYKRNIFYTVEFESEENSMIEEIENSLYESDPKPPDWWTGGDTLRFIYEFDWDLELAEKVKIF